MERFKESISDAVAYKTVKLVKTYDKTLILMHLFFMSCITIFTFFSMIVSHNYMKFEVPTTVITTKMESSDYAAAAGGSFADLGWRPSSRAWASPTSGSTRTTGRPR